jgi:hypothetical protein
MRKKHERFQPEGYIMEIKEVNNTIIYYHPTKFEAIGFTGRSNKPFFYNFYGTWDLMIENIEYHIKNVRDKAERKARRKALDEWEAKELLEETKPGDIFVSSWGYDQTNIDFYQVVKVSGKSIIFRPIEQIHVRDTGFMSEAVIAKKNAFTGDSFRKVVKSSYISHKCGLLEKWNGKEEHQSHYA